MANGLKYDPPTTKNGYDLLETLSAIQKEIRRCKEYEAVYWAVELESLNSKALWNRLKVIASEDIGLADPQAAILIALLEKNYYEALNKKDNPSRLFLVHAVLHLAKAPKSRIVDNLLTIVYNTEEKLAMPDYALDMHTHRGRKMGRGLEHFFAEGAKMANQALEDPYETRAFETLKKQLKKKTC
jgi:replication-associated recombination protein RarA